MFNELQVITITTISKKQWIEELYIYKRIVLTNMIKRIYITNHTIIKSLIPNMLQVTDVLQVWNIHIYNKRERERYEELTQEIF